MKLCVTDSFSLDVGAHVACTELAHRLGYTDIEQEETEGQARITLTGPKQVTMVFRGKTLEKAYMSGVNKLIKTAVEKYGGQEF